MRSGDTEGARAQTTRARGDAQPVSTLPRARETHPLSSGAGGVARGATGKDSAAKCRRSALLRAHPNYSVEQHNSAPLADHESEGNLVPAPANSGGSLDCAEDLRLGGPLPGHGLTWIQAFPRGRTRGGAALRLGLIPGSDFMGLIFEKYFSPL